MAESSSTSTTKTFTVAQVAEHNSREAGIWIIIHDKVYDVTKFLVEHPGGEEVLIEVAGKESTEEFEDVGHSSGAKEMLLRYYVGDIVDAEKKEKSKEADKSKMYIMIGSAVVFCIGSYILYRMIKSGK